MITLCGKCGKEKCECGEIAPAQKKPWHWTDEVNIKTVLVKSPVVLPDIGECAVYGQKKPAVPNYKTADKVLRKALGGKK
jgi:hypothetical protein